MWQDIRRICEAPTDEDRQWFPDIAGSDWRETSTSRCATSRTKVAQFLSPKVMRDFRLFAILDDDKDARLKVSAIHDEAGYRRVREILSDNYNLGSREPNLQVWNVDLRGDRSSPCATRPTCAARSPATAKRCSSTSPTWASPCASKSPGGRQRHLPARCAAIAEGTTRRRSDVTPTA
jgi:hypothetical protein